MALEDARDYPELNKCPDCETFFATDTCPLCGKICPEEMRAGNRKQIKKKKKYFHETHTSGRVQFVPWYLSTWFTILMLVWQPIIGLILTWAGYWKRKWKILVTVLLVVLYVGGYVIIAFLGNLFTMFYHEKIPVDTDASREEYIQMCEEETLTVEQIYRESEAHEGKYVTLSLTVLGIWEDQSEYDSEYNLYLQCTAVENDRTWTFLIRDYRQTEAINFAAGDMIRIYGQVGGNASIYNQTAGDLSAPCINMLYANLVG